MESFIECYLVIDIYWILMLILIIFGGMPYASKRNFYYKLLADNHYEKFRTANAVFSLA